MTFLRRVSRIPLLPISFIENNYLQKYLKHGATQYTLVKYDMEYLHGDIVHKDSSLGDIHIYPNYIPHDTAKTNGKLILTKNLGIPQKGLIYFGIQDYQMVCGISSKLTLHEIQNLTLGWIIHNH